MTFEEAKDRIANDYEYRDWNHAVACFARVRAIKTMDVMYRQAAELYVQEAIKADRQRIAQLCQRQPNIHDGVSFSCPFDVESIINLPINL